MPSRRLDDRIRELCAKAIVVSNTDEFHSILVQLRAALREHTERLRKLAVMKLAPKRRAS